jgi:diguanylate cyclase (GGDEF)-like protein/PAS domain S-box-containing protein
MFWASRIDNEMTNDGARSLSVKAMSKLIVTGVITLTLVMTGLAFWLDLPARIEKGVIGHKAIQTLDATRRPFLAMKLAENVLLHDLHGKTVDEKLARAIADGRQLLVDFLNLAGYEPELEQQVKRLSGLFEVWLTEEQRFFDIARLPRAAANRANEALYHKALAQVSEGFMATMAALGAAEVPIHRTIDAGDAAMRQLQLLVGLFLAILIAAVLLFLWLRPRELRRQVTERTAELNTALDDLKQEIDERRQAEEKMQSVLAKLEHLLMASPTVLYSCRIDGDRFFPTFASENIKDLYGYEPGKLLENPDWWPEHIHPEDQQRIFAGLPSLFEKDKLIHEYRFRLKNGSYRWIQDEINLLRNDKGEPGEVVGTWVDVTGRKEAEKSLKVSEEKFRGVTEESPNMIFINQEGQIRFANSQYEKTMGYSIGELCAPDFDFRCLIAPEHLDMVNANFARHMQGEEVEPYECTLITRDGRRLDTIHATKLVKYGQGQAILGTITDITERKQAEEKIMQLAHFDQTTGLPNRSLFYDRLAQATALAKRHGNRLALLFLDLDGFKQVNDSFGHDTGDGLLQGVAERLRHNTREADTVARIGGDEFVFILNDISDAEGAAVVAENIVRSLAEPFVIRSNTCQIGGSIGISIFPDDSKDQKVLVTQADKAMYGAKQSGKNKYRFYGEHAQ